VKSEDWDFDPEQCTVIEVEPEVRQLVLAGPGSGKTEVVVGLLERLVDHHGLSPADELLVISFSRAAVAAVRRRAVASNGRSVVTVRTLDSLAALLLEELDGGDELRDGSFNDRIKLANGLLDELGSEQLSMLRHVVVDEVQDVVGIRAEFLCTLLRCVEDDIGFTLLGDPMQALYDFQRGDETDMTSVDLLDSLRQEFGVTEHRLSGEYRSRSPEAATAAALGPKLLQEPDASKRARELERFVSRLLTVGDLPQLALLLPKWEGTTAVLCRTNGEALVVAGELRAAGAVVALQRSAQEPALASWVAEALADQTTSAVSKDALFAALGDPKLLDAEMAWRWLRTAAGTKGKTLNVPSLARRMAAGAIPIELQSGAAAPVIVSTVHRAKGLEFDNVVLVSPHRWTVDPSTLAEDVRTLFVAATRSRDRMVTVAGPEMKGLRLDPRSGRWIRIRQTWQTLGFEIVGSDTRAPYPVGDDPAETQRYLPSIKPGDQVTMMLDPGRSTLMLPRYSVLHAGRLVARTSEDFGEKLVRRIGPGDRRKGRPWPELDGAVVEGLETAAGTPPPLSGISAGRWGLWLNVRLTGMLELSW